MDKKKLNNQIIGMRKFVKQGKLHIISELVKEVRLLKAKKGNEVQMAENNRRAERLLSEINLLKKINVDSVSKMCLLSEEDWKSKISDNTASLEDCAMARLANFKGIQKKVTNFRMKFPHLVKVLPDLIRQWEERKQQQSYEGKRLTASEIKKRNKEKRLKLLEKKEEKSLFPKEHTNNSPNLRDPQFNAEEKEHFTIKENSEIENWPNESMGNFENQIEIFHGSNDDAVNPEEHEEKLNNSSDSENEIEIVNRSNYETVNPEEHDVLNISSDSENEIETFHHSNYEAVNPEEHEKEGNYHSSEEEHSDKHVDSETTINNSETSTLNQSVGNAITLKSPAFFKSRKEIQLKTPVSTHSISSPIKPLREAKKSSVKEIMLLNLEKLGECSEIPVSQVHSEDDDKAEEAEEVSTGKKVRDPFFLYSEGDGDDIFAGEDAMAPQSSFQQKSNNNRFSKFSRPGRNFGNRFAQNRRMPFHSSDFPRGNQDYHSNERNLNFGNKYQSNAITSSAGEDVITPRNRFQQNNSKEKFIQSTNTNPGGCNNKFDNKNTTANQFSKFGKPDWKSNNNRFSKFSRAGRNFGNKFAQNTRMPFCPSTDFPSGNHDFNSNNRNSNSGNKFPRDSNQKDGQKFSKFSKDKAKQPILHPSWEAKKKQNMTNGIAVFQGKKIKFDDV